jgi:hypothetical protein
MSLLAGDVRPATVLPGDYSDVDCIRASSDCCAISSTLQ